MLPPGTETVGKQYYCLQRYKTSKSDTRVRKHSSRMKQIHTSSPSGSELFWEIWNEDIGE